MITLNELKSNYLNLMEGKTTIKEFEHWVYQADWLERALSEFEYADLISLNYNMPGAKQEIGRILKAHLDPGKFETVKMLRQLEAIIDRDGNEGEALCAMYHLYCQGYSFLKDLGLGIGLFIEVPDKYPADQFQALNEAQKKELLDSVFPTARDLAVAVKNWILNGEIILTGEKEETRNTWMYLDNRNDPDKISRVWKVIKQDESSTVEANLLIDDNGHFLKEPG